MNTIPTPIDPTQRAVRPAYVRFTRAPVEDRNATMRAGHVVEVHRDVALISPVGSKDVVERDVKSWLENLDFQVRDGAIPPQLADYYRDIYLRWCQGQEMPPAGTPILGWQLLSSGDQQRVIAANILTVEDLAEASHSYIQSIGMGAPAMVEKAKHWLAVAQDQGAMALQLSQLQAQNADQSRQLEELRSALADVQNRPAARGWPKGKPRGTRKKQEEQITEGSGWSVSEPTGV